MTREKWRIIGESVGLAAIVASLIMVAIELKQNTDMTRAQIIQSRAVAAIDLADTFYNSDHLPEIFVKAKSDQDLSEEELARYQFWIRASLRNQDNNLQQYNQGLLGDHMPRVVATSVRNIISQSAISRRYWANSKVGYSDEFVEFVETALSDSRSDTE
jgi:hypothetical protein